MAASARSDKKSNLSYFSSLPAVTPSVPSSSSEKFAAAAALPPFEILLQWLAYYHAQSGIWPAPPGPNEIPISQKNLTVNTEVASPPIKLEDVSRERNLAAAEQRDASFNSGSGSGSGSHSRSSYNYRGSIYYTVASEISHTSTSTTQGPISPGALLVLASILAWSQHPFFKDKCLTSRPWMSLPLSRWSRELKMRKASLALYLEELQKAGLVSYGTLNDNILEKSEAQLLYEERHKLALLTASNRSNSYSKGGTTRLAPGYVRIYRLAKPLPRALPTFDSQTAFFSVYNPDPNPNPNPDLDPIRGLSLGGPKIGTARHQDRTNLQEAAGADRQMFSEPHKKLTEAVPGRPEPLSLASSSSGVVPCTWSYLNHDFKTYKNHDLSMVQSGPGEACSVNQALALPQEPLNMATPVANEQDTPANGFENSQPGFSEALFQFLTTEAGFPGYARSDGRRTLDEREARKFAFSQTLTLERTKQIYNQVLSLWKAGKCNKNPIGFFHNRLNKDLHTSGSATGPGSPKIPILPVSDPSPVAPQGAAADILRSEVLLANPGPLSESSLDLDLSRLSPIEPVSTNTNQSDFTSDTDLLLIQEALGALKKNVVEALSARYRRPDLSIIGEDREWKVLRQAGAEEELQIMLEESASRFYYPSYLTASDRSLFKLAISQGLTSILGKKVNIQLLS